MNVKSGLYEHYKGGRYRVLGLATHSETHESMVVYQCLYGDRGVWVRPAAMFSEEVTVAGVSLPRFRYLSAADDWQVEPQQ